MARDLLVLSGGHPYEAEPFDALIHSLGDWEVTHLIHPEAEDAVAQGRALHADAVLFYDMGGYDFAEPDWSEFFAVIKRTVLLSVKICVHKSVTSPYTSL